MNSRSKFASRKSPFSGVAILIAFAALSLEVQSANGQKQAALPPNVHRVLFLGDSITYAGGYVAFTEAYFISRYPEKSIEFINVGLPSETVSGLTEQGHAGGRFPRPDLHERLARVLQATQPDRVFACYGINDGIYQPFSEERFAKFKEGISWLHQEVTKAGASITHLTPPTFDEVNGGHPGYSSVMSKYSNWLLEQRVGSNWDVVDVQRPMDSFLAERRATDPNFAYARDGVHANQLGHWIIARQLLLHLGAADIPPATDMVQMLASFPHGNEFFKLVQTRQDLMKDAWLSSTHHTRPEMNPGLPLDEARAKTAEIDKEIRAMVKPGG